MQPSRHGEKTRMIHALWVKSQCKTTKLNNYSKLKKAALIRFELLNPSFKKYLFVYYLPDDGISSHETRAGIIARIWHMFTTSIMVTAGHQHPQITSTQRPHSIPTACQILQLRCSVHQDLCLSRSPACQDFQSRCMQPRVPGATVDSCGFT